MSINRNNLSMSTAAREARARRALAKDGIVLSKYRGRDRRHHLYGTYMLVDAISNGVVLGDTRTGFGMTLDEIETRLRQEVSNAATPSDDALRRLAGVFGAVSCSYGNHVPAMTPGDFDVVDADDEFETQVTLLEEGIACRTTVRHSTGEVFEGEVFEVPVDYGELRLDPTK